MIGAGLVRNFVAQINAVQAAVLAQLAAVGGATLIGFQAGGVGAALRTVWAVLMDRPLSVKHYGATGDGVTNDSAAVQAAIDAAVALGKSLFFPAGVYIGSQQYAQMLGYTAERRAIWTIPAGAVLRIVGEGVGLSVLRTAAADPTYGHFWIDTGAAVEFEGLTMHGRRTVSYSGYCRAINGRALARLSVRDCEFYELDLGVCVERSMEGAQEQSQDLSVSGCLFRDMFALGVNTKMGGAKRIKVEGNTFRNFVGGGPITIEAEDNQRAEIDCELIAVTGNVIDVSASNGIVIAEKARRCTIAGNVINGCLDAGVFLSSSYSAGDDAVTPDAQSDTPVSEVVVSGNVITAGATGIEVDTEDGVHDKLLIVGNLISSMTGSGVRLGGGLAAYALGAINNLTIADNEIHGCGGAGVTAINVNANQMNYLRVIGNRVATTGAGADGIQVRAGTEITIAGNDVRGAGRHGIYAQMCSGLRVKANNVKGSGTHGVNVYGCSKAEIVANTSRENVSGGLRVEALAVTAPSDDVFIGANRCAGNGGTGLTMTGTGRSNHRVGSNNLSGNTGADISGTADNFNTAAPVAGAWVVGDVVAKSNVTSGVNAGWVCVAAGTPGTWAPFGAVRGGNVYTASNASVDRTYDANATTVDELADVLGTLIADLKTAGLLS